MSVRHIGYFPLFGQFNLVGTFGQALPDGNPPRPCMVDIADLNPVYADYFPVITELTPAMAAYWIAKTYRFSGTLSFEYVSDPGVFTDFTYNSVITTDPINVSQNFLVCGEGAFYAEEFGVNITNLQMFLAPILSGNPFGPPIIKDEEFYRPQFYFYDDDGLGGGEWSTLPATGTISSALIEFPDMPGATASIYANADFINITGTLTMEILDRWT